MTTAAAQGPARVPTPLPHPPPPSTPAPEAVTASGSRPSPTLETPVKNGAQRPAGATPAPRRGARTPTADPVSDRATTLLIRRILCPQHVDKAKATPPPLEDLLPPLTSRNDVDLQLYALIAIILREFVQNWYNKITPDEAFVAEIVQIIAHLTRTLEQRLRKVDLESLLFDELPGLLDQHVTAYRTAHDPVNYHPIKRNPREIYHSLCPLPALSPTPRPGDPASVTEQSNNEVAYRQLLVHAVLAVVLPTEDLENDCLTALVGQIFSELIVANAVANKLSEPWMIYEMLIIVSRVVQERRAKNGAAPAERGSKKSWSASIQSLFWTFLQWCFLAVSSGRMLITLVMASRSVPVRVFRGAGHHDDLTNKRAAIETKRPASWSETRPRPVKTPVLAFRCWAAASNLMELEVRMPWLHGTLSLLQWIAVTGPGHVADVNGRLDRLLSYAIAHHLLEPALLPPLLRSVRAALFPNNAPGTSSLTPPTSDAELAALRRRCASAVLALLPRPVASLVLRGTEFGAACGHTRAARSGPRDDQDDELLLLLDEIERGVLGVFGDAYCNKHLVYGLVELVLVRLMPELAERGVLELWRERIA